MIKVRFLNFIHYSTPIAVNMHYHDCYEFVYYHNGTGTFQYAEEGIEKKDNSLLLISKAAKDMDKERITYTNSSLSQNMQTVNFQPHTYAIFKPFVYHSETHVTTPRVTTIGFSVDDETDIPNIAKIDTLNLEKLIDKIYAEYTNKPYLYLAAISNLTESILIKALRDSDASSKTVSLDYAKNYIEQYYTSNIDVRELAYSCGYCLDHFRLLFRQQYKLTPKQYILKLRMEQANNLLHLSDWSMKQIALECGYEEYKMFEIAYKKYMGCSPTDYRNLSKKG